MKKIDRIGSMFPNKTTKEGGEIVVKFESFFEPTPRKVAFFLCFSSPKDMSFLFISLSTLLWCSSFFEVKKTNKKKSQNLKMLLYFYCNIL